MTGWTTCRVCNRVLYTEDGPVCPDCIDKVPPEEMEEPEEAEQEPEEADTALDE